MADTPGQSVGNSGRELKMGRTRVFSLLVLFLGSILLLVALGCAGSASQTTSMNPAPPSGGGSGSGGSGGGSGGSGGGNGGGGGGGNKPALASPLFFRGAGLETGSAPGGNNKKPHRPGFPACGPPFYAG